MSENNSFIGGVIETIKTVVYALLIAGVFRTLFFQPFWIPTGSMKETLLIGDFLFVNKMAYGYSYASCPSLPFIGVDAKSLCSVFDGDNNRFLGGEPERGDVVVTVRIDAGEACRWEGEQLIQEVPVPYSVLMLGGKVEVRLPSGKVGKLTVAAMTQVGDRRRMANAGYNGGDLTLEFGLNEPESLTKAQSAALEELKKAGL